MELTIHAQTNNPYIILEADPKTIDFGEILIGSAGKKSIEVKNLETLDARLKVVSEPYNEYVSSYTIDEYELNTGQSTIVEVSLRDDIPPGEFITSISLESNDNPETRVSIPIIGKVVEKLSAAKAN